MNKNMNTTANTITLPKEAFAHMFAVMDKLSTMHLELIQLYEMESELKKHHKAYLHVREHAEEVCKEDKKTVYALIESLNPENFVSAEKKDTAPLVEDVFDPEKCAGCASYDECEAYAADQERQADDKSAVLMTTETLGQMQEDMLHLCNLIDCFMDMFASILRGQPVSREELSAAMHEAVDLTDEVIDRWDEADMVAVL